MLAPLRACVSRSSTFAVTQRPFQRAGFSDFVDPFFGTVEKGEPVLSQSGNGSQPPQPGPDGYAGPVQYRASSFPSLLPPRKLRLHCHSSPNNTITTLTKDDGSTIAWFSGGSCGFKKGNRASYEAGYQCAVRMFKRIEEEAKQGGPVAVELFLKGFGQGREALKGALLAAEGERMRPLVITVTDRTPIKIGGTRSKKTARL